MTTKSQKHATNVTDTSPTVLDEAKSLAEKISTLVGALPAMTGTDVGDTSVPSGE